jgi:hypothetical protein
MEVTTGNQDGQALLGRYLASTPRVSFYLFFAAALGLMLWAWQVRDFHYLQAESGLGYLLGIVGGSMMLVLLLYPLSKRIRIMQRWLKLQTWFRMHMLLGVLGPACILLHANFKLGSTNSTVALGAMLLVAGSGLIGRYLYGKFHYGLYGGQVQLKQIRADLDELCREMGEQPTSEARDSLDSLRRTCSEIIESQHLRVSFRQLMRQRSSLRRARKALVPVVAGECGSAGESHYRALVGLLDKLAGLRLCERLFALWHVVHIPVFLLMVATVVVHIFVVHRF